MEYIFPAVLAVLSPGISLLAFRFLERLPEQEDADHQNPEAPDNSIVQASGTAGEKLPCLRLPAMTPKRWIWLVIWALLTVCGGWFSAADGIHWTGLMQYGITVLALSAAGLIDGESKIIPNKLVLLYGAAGGVLLVIKCLANPSEGLLYLITAVAGLLGSFLIFMLMSLLTKGGIGMGDVKLIMALGFALGLADALISVLLGMIMCMLVSLVLILIGTKKMKDVMPFGPFIFLGYIVVTVLQTLI